MSSALSRTWDFLKVRKRYWLLPMLLVLAVFAALVVLSVGSEGNFVYTLN
ncbi:MAG TPA: DUF5989 family protein [Myxococcota bacterium]|nr:DUF5989 family protein [Myxococcota bacterium]